MKIFRRVISALVFLLLILRLEDPSVTLAHLLITGALVLIAGGVAWMFQSVFPKKFLIGSVAVVLIPALLVPWLQALRESNDVLYSFLMLGSFVATCKLVFGRR